MEHVHTIASALAPYALPAAKVVATAAAGLLAAAVLNA